MDAKEFFIDEKKNLVFLYKTIMKQKLFKLMVEKNDEFPESVLRTVFNQEETHGLTIIKQLHKIFKNRRNQESSKIKKMFEIYKHCLFKSLDFYLKRNVLFPDYSILMFSLEKILIITVIGLWNWLMELLKRNQDYVSQSKFMMKL